MLKFGEFIREHSGENISVVSTSDSFIDSIDSINEQLDLCLTECWLNPYLGWVNASKIMAPYGIQLPRIIFRDIQEGEEVVALNLEESKENYYFYYNYNFTKEGYESFATIANETELEELLKE